MEGIVICHHGIKGQKWGVRRYQNKDGTLTKAGKEHAKEGRIIGEMSDGTSRTLVKAHVGKKDTVDRGPDPETIDDFGVRAVHASKRFYESPNGEDGELGPNSLSYYDNLSLDTDKAEAKYLKSINKDRYNLSQDEEAELNKRLDKVYEDYGGDDGLLMAQLKDIGVKDIKSSLKKAKNLGIEDLLDLSYDYWDDHWNDSDYMEHSILCHQGVKGMKWGVRRAAKRSEDYNRAHSKKSQKSLSDKDLRERINRLQMEEQYRNLKSNSTVAKRGAKTVAKMLSGVAIGVATAKLSKYANKGASLLGKKIKDKILDIPMKAFAKSL